VLTKAEKKTYAVPEGNGGDLPSITELRSFYISTEGSSAPRVSDKKTLLPSSFPDESGPQLVERKRDSGGERGNAGLRKGKKKGEGPASFGKAGESKRERSSRPTQKVGMKEEFIWGPPTVTGGLVKSIG